MTLISPAKVNLFLEVLSRREDGFHEIDSVLATIDLHDQIEILPTESSGVVLETDTPKLPRDRGNLVVQAAELFFDQTGIRGGATIRLKKQIPIGSGLGGGSSNATTTLLGLDRLYETQLRPSILEEWAARIGSDCPFFVRGPDSGWARIRGRGERVQPLSPPTIPLSLILLLPPFPIATPEIYRHSDELLTGVRVSCEKLTDRLHQNSPSQKPIDSALFNRLSRTARNRSQLLNQFFHDVAEAIHHSIHLSGSGSAAFLLFEQPTPPAKTLAKLKENFSETQVLSCRFQPRHR
ncbi:MAG: 4-(cytidine 5'-diphospho)-2-C-methyl-D-erythritol kinase [Planctomycetota bacterium]|nr:4-(cytidine 5'-diphospho)-2-C-methyl-D-erythritol kinase [Planctomycetota bacterium]